MIERYNLGEHLYFSREIKNDEVMRTFFEYENYHPNGESCFVGVHTDDYCLNKLFNYISESIK